MTSPNVIIRTDATPGIGGGHVMRCMALADALEARGSRVSFAVSDDAVGMFRELGLSRYECVTLAGETLSAPETLKMAFPGGCDAVVVDHYGLDAAYEGPLRGWARRIVAIDDLADRPHDCDVLLDQTLGRDESHYRGLIPQGCGLLLGPEYALLRPEFAIARDAAMRTSVVSSTPLNVLVTMGLTDPTNMSETVLSGLERLELEMKVTVVLGSQAEGLATVREQATRMRHSVCILEDSDDMAALMMSADIAIGGAGSTSWERCCLGLPCLHVVLAYNQRMIAQELEAAGATVSLGEGGKLTPEAVADGVAGIVSNLEVLSDMSSKAGSLCDGRGAVRVARVITNEKVASRPVRNGDQKILFEWQTVPGQRRYSRNPEPPVWDEHLQWFETRLGNPTGAFDLLVHGGDPVGMVRLDRKPDLDEAFGGKPAYEVSILIAPDRQGQGIGRAGLDVARALAPEGVILANVHPDNIPSLKIFDHAGYRRENDWIVSRP